jgi:hypothetical protein
MADLKFSSTSRGFRLIEFADRYGAECSIQKSSLATEDAIWFGTASAEPKIMAAQASAHGIDPGDGTGWVPFPIPREVSLNTRMHLTRGQVEELLPIFQHFVQYGELPGEVAARSAVPAQAGAAEVDCSALLEAAMKDAYDHIGKCMHDGRVPEKAETDKRIVKYIVDRAAAQPQAQGEHSAGVGDARTDISRRLRATLANCGPTALPEAFREVMQTAADECDRFYNGMMAWKSTAQDKDRIIIELRAATSAPAAPTLGEGEAEAVMISGDELAALHRFYECAEDGEGYDVHADIMQRLAALGLLHTPKARRTYYETTTFGVAVMAMSRTIKGPLTVLLANAATAQGDGEHSGRVDDTQRLDFITGTSWSVYWMQSGGKPKRYRMRDDGESWGQWHSTPRAAIDAAMPVAAAHKAQQEQP